jgi:hypothetical protein
MYKVGDRVKATTPAWLKSDTGTVVDTQPELHPFATENVAISGRCKVMWDEHGISGWISETELKSA